MSFALLSALSFFITLWFHERAWRKRMQHERQWWMDSAFKASRMVDDVQEINFQLLEKLKRATGARKDVN